MFYEIGGTATEASLEVENLNHFKTKELKLSFLCVDTSGEHKTGDPVEWTNDIKIRYKIQDTPQGKLVRFQSHPSVKIRYTTDGSNPKEYGGVYHDEFVLPEHTTFIQVVAEYNGEYFDYQQIKVEKTKDVASAINKEAKLELMKRFKTNDTNDTYSELALLKKHQATISDIQLTLFKADSGNSGWIDLSMDSSTIVDTDKLEQTIEHLRNSFMNDGKISINLEYNLVHFKTGQHFLDWAMEKRLSLSDISEQEVRQQ